MRRVDPAYAENRRTSPDTGRTYRDSGLDLLLRLGVDLAVMQRRAPIGRALEHGEMPDVSRDGLDRLHAGGAGADHGDALAGEVDRFMRPSRGVERWPPKLIAAFDTRQGRGRQRADGGDQEAGAEVSSILQS